MKRFVFAPLLGLFLLAGCLSPAQKVTAETAQQKAVFALDSALTSAEVAASTYASLPFCAKGTTITITNVCADPALVIKLDTQAKAANTAIAALESTVQSNPATDITSALSDGWVLVNTYTQLVASLKGA